MKYTKKQYKKYVSGFNEDSNDKPISFDMWNKLQPIADSIVGKVNGIIRREIKSEKEAK